MENKEMTYISLFSCAGVGCFGFKQENFSCIATNEINDRRLQIQKYNNKCVRENGYVLGDIKEAEVKQKIYNEIKWWKKYKKIKNVDVIIATPPCQGMSVANHKKKDDEIKRNSLVVEAIELIEKINSNFFIIENVPSFLKTFCIYNNSAITIGKAIDSILGFNYIIHSKVLNFKNHGANSSRTRTLVIGVKKTLSKYISPIELFPSQESEKSLKEVIGNLPSLKIFGEVFENDIYHSFREYPKYMLKWVENLKEGESAFDNLDEKARPHSIKNGELIPNKNKNGGKYCRMYWNKVATSVHTRNDQLASQTTIHPVDNRVLSIRELMLIMNIPYEFNWTTISQASLNDLPEINKKQFFKKNEMLIRQCIGEAVPTIIFNKIAKNIKNFLSSEIISNNKICDIIKNNMLSDFEHLITYTQNNLYDKNILRIAELANNQRENNAAYYTGKDVLTHIYNILPEINKDVIRILEPSVGIGNYLPFILKKYSNAKKLIIDVVDIDNNSLCIAKTLIETEIKDNIQINYINNDFLLQDFDCKYDLVIGNPPFKKLSLLDCKKIYGKKSKLMKSKHLVSYFLEKSCELSDNVLFILPKSFLNQSDYSEIRSEISRKNIYSIIDLGARAFIGVNIETICIAINTRNKIGTTKIYSIPQNKTIEQRQGYITDVKLPTWILYRDEFFDSVLNKKRMNVFTAYRDRTLTNKNTSANGLIWIVQSRNIDRNGTLIHLDKYDKYIDSATVKNNNLSRFLDKSNIFIVPNMTYYPRIVEKPHGVLVNGTVAMLFPKENQFITHEDLNYLCGSEFENFYKIAMNYSIRTLNVDSATVYYYCTNK